MKACLTILLLFIAIAGTVFPCCLVDECNDDEIAMTGNKDKQPEGNCSPFFGCATCTGFTEMTQPVLLKQPVSEKFQQYQGLVVFQLSTYASSFWQPPRLC